MGSAPGWEDTPVNNGFIWGVNNTHFLKDVDRIIDVHVSRLNPQELKDKYHLEELKERDIEAYLHSEMPGMPNVKRYPIEKIIDHFGVDYFGSGIDYMIALAIYEGATEIHIYGVAMIKGSEYEHQKPSVEFWLGVCAGRGLKFEVHGDISEILKTHNGLMYGYQTPQKWVKKKHPKYISLEELMDKYESEKDEN